MQKTIRKKRSVLQFVLLITFFTMLSTMNVSAATIAKIGNKGYSSLQAAVDHVKNGQTIKLQKNYKSQPESFLTHTFEVNRKVSFTLDLNRHTLSCVGNNADIQINKGSVTIKNGTIKSLKKNGYWGGDIYVKKGAKLNIKSGTYYDILVSNMGGAVNISGGTFTFKKRDSGTMAGFFNHGGTMTLSGIRLSSNREYSIINNAKEYNGIKGVLNIKSGTYTGTLGWPCDELISNSGTAKITGGTFKTTGGDAEDACISNFGTMTISKITCTSFSPCVHAGASGKVTIKSGTFTHTSAYGGTILVSGDASKLEITGGTFKATGKKLYDGCAVYCGDGSTVTLKGGKYSCPNDPSHAPVYVGLYAKKYTCKVKNVKTSSSLPS